MKDSDSRLVVLACRFLELGKPEYWVVDALVQGENLDRAAALELVSRVSRGLESRFRRRRRLMWIGVVLIAAAVLPLYLGLPFGKYSREPLLPSLFPAGSNLPYLFLFPAFIGAYFLFHGLHGRRLRLPPRSPERLPPGHIPPGWPDSDTDHEIQAPRDSK